MLVFLCAVMLGGCGVVKSISNVINPPEEKPIVKTQRTNNITRVLMNKPGSYTILVRQSDGSDVTQGLWTNGNVKFVYDVPQGQLMWAEDTYCSNVSCPDKSGLLFHLHSVSEVEGGGWEEKHHYRHYTDVERGTTTVIQ